MNGISLNEMRRIVLFIAAGAAAALLMWLASREDPRKSWAIVLGLLFVQVYTLNFATLHLQGAGYFLAGMGLVMTTAGGVRTCQRSAAQSDGEGMSTAVQELTTLDRVVHEPARLAIMTVLYGAGEADFLYLQRECGLREICRAI